MPRRSLGITAEEDVDDSNVATANAPAQQRREPIRQQAPKQDSATPEVPPPKR
jgi:hypothetical protein